jgi:general nucleoside transport system permease protein
VALLARLNPIAVIPTALLYGGMSVGADAMQRRADIPSSITFILQSLTVLLVLAFDALRYYKINFHIFPGRTPPPAAQEVSK